MNPKKSFHLFLMILVLCLPLPSLSSAAQNEQHLELYVETGHSNSIVSLAISPDGEVLASGSHDGTIKLWDFRTGQELKTLIGHPLLVMSVAFSPDGENLASVGSDGDVKLWNVATGQELAHIPTPASRVSFSPDGKILASMGSYGVKLWDMKTNQQLGNYEDSGADDAVTFSPNGKLIAWVNNDFSIRLWNKDSAAKSLVLLGHKSYVQSLVFSRDGKTLISGGNDNLIKFWAVEDGMELKTLTGHTQEILTLAVSPDGDILASGGVDALIKLWDIKSGTELRTLARDSGWIHSLEFSPDGKTLISGSDDKAIRYWDTSSWQVSKTLGNHIVGNSTYEISPDGRVIASGSQGGLINLWNVTSGQGMKTLEGHSKNLPAKSRTIKSFAFSPDSKVLASGGEDGVVKLWNVVTGQAIKTLERHRGEVAKVVFSPNGQMLISTDGWEVKLWDVRTGRKVRDFKMDGFDDIDQMALSLDNQKLAIELSGGDAIGIELWDVPTGGSIKSLSYSYFYTEDKAELRKIKKKYDAIRRIVPTFASEHEGRFRVQEGENSKLDIYVDKRIVITLIALGDNDWIVTTPEGRFDTNQSLDRIEGLHWIVNDEIRKPLSLDVFMRQYYEPGLLRRVLSDEQFKPIPSIGNINRVRPEVAIKRIESDQAAETVDVTVEVESVTDDVSVSATDHAKKKRLSSGAFDLRLFRDGQLVGVSAPKDEVAQFIHDAPRLVAETKASGKLLDTPEDRAWRKANDIFKLKSDNVTFNSHNRVEYTFRNVKLPKDGRREVEFTAYAFNADKVKSTTTEPFKFTIPAAIANVPKKGRAVVLSIGVNASENPVYDLRYAANDARKMQEVVGARLKADATKYSEVIQIPLISDYGAGRSLTENTAQKAIIKGVFSLLAGNEKEVPDEILKQIPNRDKIKAVEPEDTLIITYAGHGYADQAGIFYLLPYDIGKDTRQITAEALRKTISSDELSLWMQDITAVQMIMIIDACHSAAAVQGDGFKPGPMGSRGLGQLAYDKDMKILAATQADNIALELNSLEQGLLSYALLQDGIVNALADIDKNKQLFTTEWLSFAEKRVPELYTEVRSGKRGVFIDGKNVKTGDRSAEKVISDGKQKSNLSLQQPSLFDFKRRTLTMPLLNLP